MLGGHGTIRQSLYQDGDGGEEELQVATAGAGLLPREREGLGKRVTDFTLPIPERRSEKGSGIGGQHRRRRRRLLGRT